MDGIDFCGQPAVYTREKNSKKVFTNNFTSNHAECRWTPAISAGRPFSLAADM
jgi:hypothetical protein